MSQENVELVREGVARFVANDITGIAELYADHAFMVAPEGWPEGGRFDGREAIARQFSRLVEEWNHHSLRIESELSEGDWVVLRLVWSTQGRASGVPVEMTVVAAYRLEDRKIAEARFFWDLDGALAAVGLR
jgi:ketosteroid isomerase-like protein